MPTEYIRYFGLAETPFARNHDLRWLYLSTQYKEAILKARWTVEEHGGLALIRGGVGQGKSFLIDYLMQVWSTQLGWRCAKMQNTGTISTPRALLAEVMAAFGLEPAFSARDMATRLETWLLTRCYEKEETVVLFIDEAQSIDSRAMPVIRDLLNLETQDRILLQIVLSAQPNIDRKLKYYPALQSRIASISSLEPLTLAETDAMLLHRFERARAADPIHLCPAETIIEIFKFSGGVPRDIIVIAEAAMKEAYLRGADRIHPQHVISVADELSARRPRLAKAA